MYRGDQMKRIDVAYALILNESEDAVLMVHNADNNSWTLPGGAVEPDETLAQRPFERLLKRPES